MKKLLISAVVSLLTMVPAIAQHNTAASDTLLLDSTATEVVDTIGMNLIDWAMGWLDTTDCSEVTHENKLSAREYQQRLDALPYIVRMPYNQVVGTYIERYLKKGRKKVGRLLRMGETYFPVIEEALSRHNLPMELKYVPIIESGFNPQARSRAGAAGLWQFMPTTGKRYGLTVNSLVDERYDVYKSTEAACLYIEALYDLFGDWDLALAAYNCGTANVRKAITRAGGKRDYWSIYPYLPKDTRVYLPMFIATAYVMNYSHEHGICPGEIDPDRQLLDTVTIDYRTMLDDVAKDMDMSLAELKQMNPKYIRNIIPGGGVYTITLPLSKAATFIEHRQNTPRGNEQNRSNEEHSFVNMKTKTDPEDDTIVYTVKKGDTLSAIAKRYNCTVKQLQRWNNMTNTRLAIGKKLNIKR